jgi:hypothetical protein
MFVRGGRKEGAVGSRSFENSVSCDKVKKGCVGGRGCLFTS